MSIPGRQLGLRPAKNAPALRFAQFWTGIPPHPRAADHFSRVGDWGLWHNDRFGTCGPVAEFNWLKMITLYLDGDEAMPTWEHDVLSLYRLNNPDFDPETGEGDNGVDMQTMLELSKDHQVFGPDHEIVAFAKVDLADLDEVRAAISIFGGVLLGVLLDNAQDAQTDERLWDYVPRSGEWGGHAVLAGAYTSDVGVGRPDIDVITWALRVGTTHAFDTHQIEEAWVIILKDHLDHPNFQEGVDLAELADAYHELTGDVLDVPPEPEPTPEPPAPEPTPEPTPEPPLPWIDKIVEVILGWVEALLGWLKKHYGP